MHERRVRRLISLGHSDGDCTRVIGEAIHFDSSKTIYCSRNADLLHPPEKFVPYHIGPFRNHPFVVFWGRQIGLCPVTAINGPLCEKLRSALAVDVVEDLLRCDVRHSRRWGHMQDQESVCLIFQLRDRHSWYLRSDAAVDQLLKCGGVSLRKIRVGQSDPGPSCIDAKNDEAPICIRKRDNAFHHAVLATRSAVAAERNS